MSISELDKIIEQETGVTICPICGTPFIPYHSRQKTCATDECRKAYRAIYMREWKDRLRKEDYEMWCKRRREYEKRSRRKKKELMITDENLKKAQEYWERREAQHSIAISDGKEYAERQMAKTLASVPKIDVNIGKDGGE